MESQRESISTEESEDVERPFLEHGSAFLRFRWHSTKSHFYIIAEACVNRQWSVKIDNDDDEKVLLTVRLPPPSFAILDKLFPGTRVDFHFEQEEETEEYVFTLLAGKKLNRSVPPKTTASPTLDTPLWYGFAFEFAEELVTIDAANVDFSDLLSEPELRKS